MLASLAIAAFAAVIFAVNVPHQRGPLALLWLAPVACVLVPLSVAFRVARTPGFSPPTRRFWKYLTVCLALAGAGAASHGYDAMGAGLPGSVMSSTTLSLYGVTVALLLWSLVRLPLGTSGPGALLRIALDAATVVIAGAVFLWYYQARPMLQVAEYRPAGLLGLSVMLLLELITVFAIVKVALVGQAYVARDALRLLAAALAAGVLSSALQWLVLDRPYLDLVQITLPALMIFVTAAAEQQQRARMAGPTRERVNKRPFSVLPYLAIGAVDLQLLMSVYSGNAPMSAALAAVALTALVVWRQLTVFQQNTELLFQLDHGATHDSLTRLPNRVLFNDRLAAALGDTCAPRPVSVALIDLDDFKTVNDTLGHGVGDTLLVTVAERLRRCVRPGDTPARLGGDEFVVLLDDITPAEAQHLMQRFIDVLAEPIVADGHGLLVRASAGIADGTGGDDPVELLRRADVAMYAAKRTGGGSALPYRSDMTTEVVDSAAVGAQLHQAISAGRLFLEYQPIVSLPDGRVQGVEALVRWTHPTAGIVYPADFIPVAERTGLMVELGDWVLREACRQFAAWSHDHGSHSPGVLHVNVSPRQLSDDGFLDQVVAALLDTGVPANRLMLEITESATVAVHDAAERLEELRRIGVRIALDDFGTGRSPLTLLHELPVDQLKLDQAFLRRSTSGRTTMPAAVLALARAAGLDIVAEGVETQDQADLLTGLGYRSAQGFHFARPMPPAEMDRLLTGHSTRPASFVAG